MSKRDPSIKLASVEANLKRWHTRLTRAANMVAKLEKYRRRLMLEKAVEGRPVVATVKVRKDKTLSETIDVDAVRRQLDAAIEATPPGSMAEKYRQQDKMLVEAVIETMPEAIPAFLDRSDPLIAEKMTAARKTAEAAERKKMPLTGKAAEDYIKAPRKRKA